MRIVRDVDLAEDLAREAVATALEGWLEIGIPDNPGAWLMATAKHRATDQLRRPRLLERKHGAIEGAASDGAPRSPDLETAIDEDVGDDLLRLLLIVCHPCCRRRHAPRRRCACSASSRPRRSRGPFSSRSRRSPGASCARSAPSPRPASALRFLVARSRPRVFPRSSRSSSSSSTKAMPPPAGTNGCAPSCARTPCGSAGASPPSCRRGPRSTDSSPWWSRTLRAPRRTSVPRESRFCSSIRSARWDRLLIQRGLAVLARAESLAQPLGPYTLQTAIVACHVRARAPDQTDGEKTVALQDALVELTRSPVGELNRAVAVSMAVGPAAALEFVDGLAAESALRAYHLLPSVHGNPLMNLGRTSEASVAFEHVASLAHEVRERARLLARASACTKPAGRDR